MNGYKNLNDALEQYAKYVIKQARTNLTKDVNKYGGNKGGGNFQFASSNPMWRASLETLDFLPLNTVDYSGGMIISDWYSDNSANDSLKITIRFLSNEVRSDSLKIIVHQKNCTANQNCRVKLMESSTITNELRSTIVRKAAVLEKEAKTKKKK